MKTHGLIQSLIQMMLLAATLLCGQAQAETVVEYLTDANGKYAGPTVEDNVAAMDADKNGFADAAEVRAYLEMKHGKGYQQELLEKFAASVSGASCGTPFANKLYVTN